MKRLLVKSYQTKLTLAIEEILRDFESLPLEDIKNFWNAQKCRLDLLPFLAICLGVDIWDDTMPEAQKRQALVSAVSVNKHKGTLGSLKRALDSLNLSTKIVEWFEDEKEPMTAVINLTETTINYTKEQYEIIYKLIDEVKRLSVSVTLSHGELIKGNLYAGGVLLESIKTDITPTAMQISFQKNMYLATSFQQKQVINIG